ncbi:MAG: hypothetical protein ACM3X3_11650 [Betaproteobacteria bacterium]
MMSYDLDAVYVVSLGLLVGLVTIPVRDWTDKRLAARGLKVHSFIWGWVAMILSMAAVVPVLLTKGARLEWRLLMAAYTEGLPVGAVAIVAYDLAFKPVKRFGGLLAKAIARRILTSVDKTGGIYGGYGYGPGSTSLGEEELEDVSCDPARGAPGDISGSEQGGTPASPP